MRLHLTTCRRAFPELYHLPQTDPGSGEVIVVFDGIYQLFGSSPRHLGFLGLAASQSQAVPQGVAVSMSFADGIEAQGCRAPMTRRMRGLDAFVRKLREMIIIQ